MKSSCPVVAALAILVFLFVAFPPSNPITNAEVSPSPITSSGLNTQTSAPLNAPGGKIQYDITGGTRPRNGTNLFHSFGDSGVRNNTIANFLNDANLAPTHTLHRA